MSKRKNHKPDFKAQVALEAIKGELTAAELASKHKVHVTQVHEWKRALLENASDLFDRGAKRKAEQSDSESQIKELHAKIGQLTMERDFLDQALKPWTKK